MVCGGASWRLTEIPIRAAVRLEGEEDYLLRRIGAGYQMVRFIERATPPGSRIYVFGISPQAYTSRELVCAFCSAANLRLLDSLGVALGSHPRLIRTLTLRSSPRRLRGIRLVESAAHAAIIPGLFQVRIFGSEGELQPRSNWSFDAHPFPWDAGLAFDGNPVTRWKTWQKIAVGAWISVEFRDEQNVIAVKCSPDPAFFQWKLDGKESSDGWFPLDAASQDEVVPAPPNLRRDAMEEFKRSHFQYLWLDANPQLADLRNRPEEWGIRRMAEFQDLSLYRID